MNLFFNQNWFRSVIIWAIVCFALVSLMPVSAVSWGGETVTVTPKNSKEENIFVYVKDNKKICNDLAIIISFPIKNIFGTLQPNLIIKKKEKKIFSSGLPVSFYDSEVMPEDKYILDNLGINATQFNGFSFCLNREYLKGTQVYLSDEANNVTHIISLDLFKKK